MCPAELTVRWPRGSGVLRERPQQPVFSSRIVAARLNGSLDFFSLETHAALSPLQFRGQRACAGHVSAAGGGQGCRVRGLPAGCFLRDGVLGPLSAGTPGRSSSPASPVYSSSDAVACRLTHTVPCAHQKPITALKAAAGRLVTGSQDHTLRVRVGSVLWGLRWPSLGWRAFGVSQGEEAEKGFPGQKWNWETIRDQNLMPTPAPGVPSGGLVLPLHPAGPLRGHHSGVY